ncbi:MAG: NAD(P)/FAD-dependent oxidoreductase [Anaerolineales bacterium]
MSELPLQRRIAVIGAGFGGLAAAYDLVKAGHAVTLFEAADYVGGLASGFKEPHWEWSMEKYYHHWFATDRYMLQLIDELGWRNQVRFPRPYTVVYYQGKFYPFDSIPQMALFPGLGWGVDKMRFGLVGLFLRLTNNWQALEKTTVEAWMRRWAGDRVYELMWQPLMIGKFGERYAPLVNMAWMWARIKARTTRLGTFEGGFQAFADRFADHLKKMGLTLHLSCAVERLLRAQEGGWKVHSAAGEAYFDQVLVTQSPSMLARLAPELPSEYLRGLLSLKSMGAVVLIFSLKHPLSPQGYYWYNIPKSAGFPFLALVEHTNFVPARYFGGEHLIYCGDYLETDHEYFQLSQDQLVERFSPALQRINANFSLQWINKTWLFRTPYAQPVPFVNHSRNIPSIRTPLGGLYYASMSQVYPWDRGTNFAVEIGRRAARLMMQD